MKVFAGTRWRRRHNSNRLREIGLSIRTRKEIAGAIDALEADSLIRVLIMTGAARASTAGLDLDEWAAPGVVAAAACEHDAVAPLQRFSGPVIGAINGLTITPSSPNTRHLIIRMI